MFDSFEPFSVVTQSSPEVTIKGLKSGDASSPLPPLLLLHGFPQTHHIWHRVAPLLLDRYTVVLMDLRGYGASSKPGGDVAQYAKSAMARDCIAVMDALGFTSRFSVCAHDRGARVAHKLCVDHPGRVRGAVLLDICPTLAMYEATGFEFAQAYWHWFFLTQPAPLPETLIGAEPRRAAEMFMGGSSLNGKGELGIFEEECWEEYVRGFADSDALHAMCQDYRAAATVDLDESRADLGAGRLVECPLLVLWGRHGVIEKCFDAMKEWRAVVKEGVPVQGYSVESGHYIPEEVPEDVVSAIQQFLK